MPKRFTAPVLPVPLLVRSRLENVLEQAANRTLVIVRGAIGCGKTVLLSSWVRGRPTRERIVWIDLDQRVLSGGCPYIFCQAARAVLT